VNLYSALEVTRCYLYDTLQIDYFTLHYYYIEILWFGSETNLRKVLPANRVISVGQSVIQPVTVVRDLDVLIDDELSMRQHVTRLSQTCFFHLHRARSLRRQLGRDVMPRLVSALVLSRLDYCNAVGYLPDSQRRHWRRYSGYCTPLESSWTSDHATMCLPLCETCTGCRSSRGLSLSCACSSTRHSSVIHQSK